MSSEQAPDYGADRSEGEPRLRFPGLAAREGEASDAGGIGGVHLGTMCHNHVLTEVYADFDGEGHLVALHPHDVGSC